MAEKDKRRCALDPVTEKRLNQQVGVEGISSAHYLAMASWCDMQGYREAAKFLYQHAEEERAHMLKLFHYINDAGGHALHPDITDITHSFQSFRQIFELTFAQETKVTQSIHQLVEHCWTSKDFSTFNFLQWFLTEQIEEEALTRRAIELFDVIGEEGIGLYTIDQALGQLKDNHA